MENKHLDDSSALTGCFDSAQHDLDFESPISQTRLPGKLTGNRTGMVGSLTEPSFCELMAAHGSDGSAPAEPIDPSTQQPRNKNMKKLLFTLTLAAALVLGGQTAFAQAKKKVPAPAPADAPADKPAASAAPVAEKPKADSEKPKNVSLHTIVDSIDASGKSFSHKNKDGKEVKNVVTSKTEIKNGEKDAKFEDIKVGDEVRGLRLKKNDAEYEVVKITYIGAPEKKPAASAKPAAEPKKK